MIYVIIYSRALHPDVSILQIELYYLILFNWKLLLKKKLQFFSSFLNNFFTLSCIESFTQSPILNYYSNSVKFSKLRSMSFRIVKCERVAVLTRDFLIDFLLLFILKLYLNLIKSFNNLTWYINLKRDLSISLIISFRRIIITFCISYLHMIWNDL